jgi:hypothetical protein
LLVSVRVPAGREQPDWAPTADALGDWPGLAVVADAVAGIGEAVGCAPPPDDDAVTVPHPAVTVARRHAATALDRKFIRASLRQPEFARADRLIVS